MPETVPADIAAAIEAYIAATRLEASFWHGKKLKGDEDAWEQADRDMDEKRRALNAAILAHLRKAEDMEAALVQAAAGA